MTISPSQCLSLICHVGTIARRIAGMALLVLGLALMSTFWLLGLGVPLALLGAALIGADQPE